MHDVELREVDLSTAEGVGLHLDDTRLSVARAVRIQVMSQVEDMRRALGRLDWRLINVELDDPPLCCRVVVPEHGSDSFPLVFVEQALELVLVHRVLLFEHDHTNVSHSCQALVQPDDTEPAHQHPPVS